MSERRVEVQKPPAAAWEAVLAAAANVGKIKETSPTTRSLRLKARYGLNPVNLRVAVLSGPTPDTSVLEFAGRGQDVIGVASRNVIDRVIQALR
jgi:hypothetical protein